MSIRTTWSRLRQSLSWQFSWCGRKSGRVIALAVKICWLPQMPRTSCRRRARTDICRIRFCVGWPLNYNARATCSDRLTGASPTLICWRCSTNTSAPAMYSAPAA